MFGMGGAGNRVHVEVTGDDTGLQQTLRGADDAGKGFLESAKRVYAKWGDEIRTKIAGEALKAVRDFVSFSVSAASDLEESGNAIGKVFGDNADIVSAFGDVAATTVGLSKREFQELASVTGALLTNVGFSTREAGKEVVTLGIRAADMASVFNTDVSQALAAINSGLKGEFDPLEQFGVKISASAVKAKALEMGLDDATGAIDDNAKATAALALVYEQTAGIQGDFLQSSDKMANQQRIMAAEAENAAATFGKAWTPVVAEVQHTIGLGMLGLQSMFGDTAAAAARAMSEASGSIINAQREGGDAASALANALAFVARESELTGGQFIALAGQAGITADKWEKFREVILRQGEAAGINRDILDEMAAAIDDAIGPTDELAGATEDGTAATLDAAAAEKEHAAKTDAARRALIEKDEALRGIHDPLFRIVKLNEDLAEAEDSAAAAEREFGSQSKEFRDSVIDRAKIIADLKKTLRDLEKNGIDPTGQAAAEMLEGLGVPPGVIAEIFRTFDRVEQNLESRDFEIRARVLPPSIPSGFTPARTATNMRFHTGGRVNAPAGQEVEAVLVGGEEVRSPAHREPAGSSGGSSGGGVTLIQNFHRVEGPNLDQDIARGLLVAGVARRIEQRKVR